MNGYGYEDDSCDAAPGLMGHLACNKSCCRESGTPSDGQYAERDYQEGVGWGGIEFTGRSKYERNDDHTADAVVYSRAWTPPPPTFFKIKYERLIHETEKAALYLVKGGKETLWLPKSIHERGKNKLKIQKWFKPQLAYVKVTSHVNYSFPVNNKDSD